MNVGIGLSVSNFSSVPTVGLDLDAAIAALFSSGEEGAWYDPSDLTTVWQDAAGTTPATVGDPVGRIDDKSGNGNHATQSTSTARPTLQLSGSSYYLDFDGVDDWMVTGSVDFTASDKMTTFAGIKRDASTLDMIVELSADWNSNAGSFEVISGTLGSGGTGPGFHAASRGSAAVNVGHFSYTDGSFAPPVDAVITSTHDISGDETVIRGNGVAYAAGTADKGAGNFGNYPLYIAIRGGTLYPLDGRIYGLIIRGASSTADEITNVESYLADKTGAFTAPVITGVPTISVS